MIARLVVALLALALGLTGAAAFRYWQPTLRRWWAAHAPSAWRWYWVTREAEQRRQFQKRCARTRGNWLKDGQPLSAEEHRLLDLSAALFKGPNTVPSPGIGDRPAGSGSRRYNPYNPT